MRAIILAVVLSLTSAVTAPGSDRYVVVSDDPATLSVVDSAQLKVVSEIPIPKRPVMAVPSRDGNLVYVLHDGGNCKRSSDAQHLPIMPKKVSSLSVVDLKRKTLLKTIPLSWNILRLQLSSDGKRLIAFGVGRRARNPKPEDLASLYVIDTEQSEILGTVRSGVLGQDMASTRDGARSFLLSTSKLEGVFGRHSDIFQTVPTDVGSCLSGEWPSAGSYHLTTVDGSGAKVGEVALPSGPSYLIMSPDEQWLYILEQGYPDKDSKRHRDGVIQAVNVQTGKLEGTYPVGTYPRYHNVDPTTGEVWFVSHVSYEDHTGKLYRFVGGEPAGALDLPKDPLSVLKLEGLPLPAIVTEKQLCVLKDRDHVDLPCVSFGDDVDLVTEKHLNFKYAGRIEAVYAPSISTVLVRSGESGEDLLLVDVKNRTMRQTQSGRPGIRLGKQIFHGIVETTFTLFALAGGARDVPNLFPPGGWTQSPIAVRPDDKYAYVSDPYTKDLTVIDLNTASGVAFHELGGRPRGQLLSPDGRHLIAFSDQRVLLLDTETNAIRMRADLHDDLRRVFVSSDNVRVIGVTEKELLVWDGNAGRGIGKVSGLHDARFAFELTGRDEAVGEVQP